MVDGIIHELLVHPIKACRAVSVQTATLTSTGLKYDRAWCVLDYHGDRFAEREAISQRKIPKMATVGVEFSENGDSLIINAPDMPTLVVPVDEDAYLDNDQVTVNCSGVSTTGGGGWHLGTMTGYSAGKEAEKWFTEYLNRPDVVKSKKTAARYLLVRSIQTSVRQLDRYAGPSQGSDSPFNHQEANVSKEDSVRFQDFGPLLMANTRSLDHLNELMGTSDYPINPFRPNIIVAGEGNPWAEETWKEFKIGDTNFRFIKECARCTVPGRNQITGEFNFKGGEFNGVKGQLLKVQTTLSKTFPDKAADDTWGSWKGPFFGVYVAPDLAGDTSSKVREVTLRVGDEVFVTRKKWTSVVEIIEFLAPFLVILVAVAYLALHPNKEEFFPF